jgi:hypothetical protein
MRVTWHEDLTDFAYEGMQRHESTATATQLHELVNCIPPRGNSTEYTDEERLESDTEFLLKDLADAVEVYKVARSDSDEDLT